MTTHEELDRDSRVLFLTSKARVTVLVAVMRYLESQDLEFRNLQEGEQAVEGSDAWIEAVVDAANAIMVIEEQLYEEADA